MSETKTVWHKYPEIKPYHNNRFYLCTVRVIDWEFLPGCGEIAILHYDEEDEGYEWGDIEQYYEVLAWAELPEQYTEGKNE